MTADRIKELLNEGSLDEAIRELKLLELAARTDDTNSVLMSANLERMRWRSNRNLIAAGDLKNETEKLVARMRSAVESLERDIEDNRRRNSQGDGRRV